MNARFNLKNYLLFSIKNTSVESSESVQDMVVLDKYVGLKFQNNSILFYVRPKILGSLIFRSNSGSLDFPQIGGLFWYFQPLNLKNQLIYLFTSPYGSQVLQ